MPIPNILYGTTVTILRRVPTENDDYGNDAYTEQSDDVSPCSVQSGASAEVTQGTDQLTSDVAVYAPAGTDISYIDALLINGEKYEVQGQPVQGLSPFTGSTPPILIRANKVTGASV